MNRKKPVFTVMPVEPQGYAIGGIIRDITTRIFGYMPKKVKKTLKEIGNNIPTNFVIMRAPVQRYINTLLNVISFGQWEQLKQKHNYDDFFHLSIVFVINGQQWRLEKNEIIKLTPYTPREGEETLPIGSSPDAKTLNEIFMETIGRVGEEQFYRYNAWSYNCQQFIMDILQTIKLDTAEATAFVKQNIDVLVEELNPKVQAGATELTDIGGAIATIGEELGFKKGGIVGVGRQKRRKNRIYNK